MQTLFLLADALAQDLHTLKATQDSQMWGELTIFVSFFFQLGGGDANLFFFFFVWLTRQHRIYFIGAALYRRKAAQTHTDWRSHGKGGDAIRMRPTRFAAHRMGGGFGGILL